MILKLMVLHVCGETIHENPFIFLLGFETEWILVLSNLRDWFGEIWLQSYTSHNLKWAVSLQHILKLIRVRNLKFATYLKFATCENTDKINELWWDLLNVY